MRKAQSRESRALFLLPRLSDYRNEVKNEKFDNPICFIFFNFFFSFKTDVYAQFGNAELSVILYQKRTSPVRAFIQTQQKVRAYPKKISPLTGLNNSHLTLPTTNAPHNIYRRSFGITMSPALHVCIRKIWRKIIFSATKDSTA